MKNLKFFSLFQVLFFGSMWMSKTLHPLYFEQSQNIQNFSFAYAAMAFSGYFSFMIGHFCDRLGYRLSLVLGCLVYGASLFLRAYPDSALVSVLSGLIGGLGAAAVISSVRIWMIEISSEENRSRIVGLRSSMTAFGTALGCALAGLLSGHIFGLRLDILLQAAGLTLIGTALIFPFLPKKSFIERSPARQPQGLLKFIYSHQNLALGTLVVGICGGFYVSFISPYLPLILKSQGFDLTSIGLSLGSLALVRFFADPLIGRWMENKKEKSFRIYIAAELFVFLTTAAFLVPFHPQSFILFLILRSLGLGLTMIAEEITWLRIFPKESLGLCFGLNQSGFFIGDFLGGLGNGKIFVHFGMEGCAIAALIVMLINLVVFSIFISSLSKRIYPEEAHAC